VEGDVQELARRYRADPSDAELRSAYERALRRAGDADGLAELFRLEFACPMKWHELAPTDDPLVRDCAGCQRSVHLAVRSEDFVAHTRAGRCVAVFDRDLAERALEAAREAATRPEPSDPPCVTPGAWYDLLLDFAQGHEDQLALGQGAGLPSEGESELLRASEQPSRFAALRAAQRLRAERDARERPTLAQRVRRWLRRG